MALSDHLAAVDDLVRRHVAGAAVVADRLRTLIARGQAVATALDRVERKRTRRLEIARDTVRTLAADLGTFVDDLFDQLDYPPQLFVDAREAQAQLYRLAVYRRGWAESARGDAGLSTDVAPGLDARGLIPYRVREGDTLERIAATTLGDEQRWWELAELNGLHYPFLRSDRPYLEPAYSGSGYGSGYETAPSPDAAEATVRVPGQTLWLPADARIPEGTGTFTSYDTELWGRDLLLDGGYLSVTPEGLFRTVEGKDNMIQALLQRIGTGRGELVLHPSYGIDRMLAVGVEGTRSNVEIAGMEVARTVAQDPRVTFVRDVAIHFVDTANRAAMRVGLIGPAQRDLALNLVIPDVVSGGGVG